MREHDPQTASDRLPAVTVRSSHCRNIFRGCGLPDIRRYYFHFEGNKPHTDTTGEMLPDDEAAWREAVRLLRDVEDAVRPGDGWTLCVSDGDEPVFVLALVTRKYRN
jgi:hypothetical protein